MYDYITCSRCGGSGHYSFNLLDGTMCYKCRGKGKVLSAIGRKAKTYFLKLATKKFSELQKGYYIRYMGQWRKVMSIDVDNQNSDRVIINLGNISYYTFTSKTFLCFANEIERQNAIKKTVIYQNKLKEESKNVKIN